jgi:pimeloyl-ACP methyl ester carboxylesterase
MFRPIAHRLARLLPRAKRSTYAGAGHIPHVTHPKEYVVELVRFIESNELTRR